MRSWWHAGSTLAVLLASLVAAAITPWWPLRLTASIIGGLVMVRAFILYHDFMHGPLLSGSRLAQVVFYALGAPRRRATGATARRPGLLSRESLGNLYATDGQLPRRRGFP